MKPICVLCKDPLIVLTKDRMNWIVCEGIKKYTTKSGKDKGQETKSLVNPGYYGDNLGAALVGAFRQMLLQKAQPGMEFKGLMELVEGSGAELRGEIDAKCLEIRKAATEVLREGE